MSYIYVDFQKELFCLFYFTPQKVNKRPVVISTEISELFKQKQAGFDTICFTEWKMTLRILSHLNRSDNCQIIEYIWQLPGSLQETRNIWYNISLWHPISLSNRDGNPPSLWISVADSFSGHLLWFFGKRILLESREDRGSLKDGKPPTVCHWKPVELTPHFAPKKDYFQWALCITNEMHIFLRCGCRHIS